MGTDSAAGRQPQLAELDKRAPRPRPNSRPAACQQQQSPPRPPTPFPLPFTLPPPPSGPPPTHLGSHHRFIIGHPILHEHVLHEALEEVKVHPSVLHRWGGGLDLRRRLDRRRLHPVHRRPHRHHRVIGGPTGSRPASHQARVLLLGCRRRRAATGQDRGCRRTEQRELVFASGRHRGHGGGGGGSGRHGKQKWLGGEGGRGGETKGQQRDSGRGRKTGSGTRQVGRGGTADGSPLRRSRRKTAGDQGRAVVTGGTRGGGGHGSRAGSCRCVSVQGAT